MKFEATCYNIWSSSISVHEFMVDVPDKTFWKRSNQDHGLVTYIGIFKRTEKRLQDHIYPSTRNHFNYIRLDTFDDFHIITICSADKISAIEQAIEEQLDVLKDSILDHYYINICQQMNGKFYVAGLLKIIDIYYNTYSTVVAIDLEDNQTSIHQATTELCNIMSRSSNTLNSSWYRIDDKKASYVWKEAQRYAMGRMGLEQYESKIQWSIDITGPIEGYIKNLLTDEIIVCIDKAAIAQDIMDYNEKIKQFKTQFFTKKPIRIY